MADRPLEPDAHPRLHAQILFLMKSVLELINRDRRIIRRRVHHHPANQVRGHLPGELGLRRRPQRDLGNRPTLYRVPSSNRVLQRVRGVHDRRRRKWSERRWTAVHEPCGKLHGIPPPCRL